MCWVSSGQSPRLQLQLSNYPSLNPTEVYNFYSIVTFKRTQGNEKEAVNGHVGLFRFKYIKTKEVPGI